MEYSKDNQQLHCGECGKDYDPLARPGFLRFIVFMLFANLLMTASIIILAFTEVARIIQLLE